MVSVKSHIQALMQAVSQADSAESLLTAVQTLAAARDPGAVDTLIEVLSFNNPGAAVAAVDGLIALGDIAVDPLLGEIHNRNYTAKAWAIRGLAGIGNPRGLATLLMAAEKDFALSVRRAATRGLGTIRWSQMAPEGVPEAQQEVLATLQRVIQGDEEWVVRYAAVVGLQGLARGMAPPEEVDENLPRIRALLQERIQDDLELAVRARAVMALRKVLNAGSPDS